MFFRPNFYRLVSGSELRKTLGSGSAINALGSIFPIKRMWIRITWCFRIQCMRIRIQVRIKFHLDLDSGGKKQQKKTVFRNIYWYNQSLTKVTANL